MSRDFAIGNINAKANVNFATLTKNQIAVIIKDEQPVFSKIAFENLGKNKKATDMLRNEMLQAVLLGESQDKLARRIKRVAGYQYNYQARRTAQTERTRVQSQAGQRAAEEAQAIGIKMTKRWSAAMVRTRDTHQHLHGQTIPIDEDFELSDGDKLNYPGDPNGSPENIINCRCRLIYEVADEKEKDTKNNDEVAEIESDNLIKEYKDIEPNITSDLQDICSKNNGTMAGLDYKLKSQESLKRKILSDSTEKRISIQEASKQVNDVLRYTIVYDIESFTDSYFMTVDYLKKKGYNLIRVKNTFTKGATYKGVNTILINYNGNRFELQFHTPQSLYIKQNQLHNLYEQQRILDKIKDKKQWDALSMKMIEISDTIINPKNAERIK